MENSNAAERFSMYLGIQGIKISTAGELVKGNGHKVGVEDALASYREACNLAGVPCIVSIQDAKEYIKENTPKEEQKPAFNLNRFILEYLAKHANPGDPKSEWRIGSDWKNVERMQNGIPVGSDLSELMQAIRAEAIKNGLGKVAKYDDIKCLVKDLAMRQAAERIEAIARQIHYDPDCVDTALKAIDTLHDLWKVRQSKEVMRAALMHVMWQVKRKLLGRKTSWQLWLNFFGGSGIGKTQFLEDLGKPFGDFYSLTSISKLLDDERQMLKLTNCYLLNIDELSVNNRETQYADKETTLGRDQQATLKALLTQTKIQARILGGQSQTTRRMTFTCVSSANEHLYDIIYDEKTMRRYYELECTASKIDFARMDKLKMHILEIWKGIDDSLEEGYLNPESPVWGEVEAEQLRYYPTNTSTGKWVNDQRIVACEPEQRDDLQEMYDDYKSYCKERGHLSKSYSKWLVDVKHLVPGSVHADTHTYIRAKPQDEA